MIGARHRYLGPAMFVKSCLSQVSKQNCKMTLSPNIYISECQNLTPVFPETSNTTHASPLNNCLFSERRRYFSHYNLCLSIFCGHSKRSLITNSSEIKTCPAFPLMHFRMRKLLSRKKENSKPAVSRQSGFHQENS